MKRLMILALVFAGWSGASGFAAEKVVGHGGYYSVPNGNARNGNQTYYYNNGRYYGNNRAYYRQPAVPAGRSYSMGPNSGVWPNYPNYGNPVGALYSRAAGMRQGQWFGTFGLHPADAKARGAY